jgi:hypothetical protein
MEVNNVEAVRLLYGRLQGQNLIGYPVPAVRIESQRLLTYRDHAGTRRGVSAREQRDIVSQLDKTFGQVRHHTLCAAIEQRRHRLMQWSNLHAAEQPARSAPDRSSRLEETRKETGDPPASSLISRRGGRYLRCYLSNLGSTTNPI